MKNIIFVVIGTLIGAGFASGKEVEIFFLRYGKSGILGMMLAGFTISLIIYRVLKIIEKCNIESYSDLIDNINDNKNTNKLIKIIINSFLLISFFIMMSGISSYFKEEFNVPTIITSCLVSILCYLTLRNNINGITKINVLLVPFLIAFIIFITSLNIDYFTKNFNYIIETKQISIIDNWIWSAILYASYNSITLIPIVIGLKKYVKNNAGKISILSGVIFITLGLCIYSILARGQNYIQYLELPVVNIIDEFGKFYSILYGVVIAIAIFTSAISAGYGFLEKYESSKKTYKQLTASICVLSIPISLIKFSFLVEILYPIFGILGLFQIFLLLKRHKVLKKIEKTDIK